MRKTLSLLLATSLVSCNSIQQSQEEKALEHYGVSINTEYHGKGNLGDYDHLNKTLYIDKQAMEEQAESSGEPTDSLYAKIIRHELNHVEVIFETEKRGINLSPMFTQEQIDTYIELLNTLTQTRSLDVRKKLFSFIEENREALAHYIITSAVLEGLAVYAEQTEGPPEPLSWYRLESIDDIYKLKRFLYYSGYAIVHPLLEEHPDATNLILDNLPTKEDYLNPFQYQKRLLNNNSRINICSLDFLP